MFQEVSAYQWIVLVLGAAGFVITWTRTAVAITRAIDKIESDTSRRMSTEMTKITEQITGLAQQFEEDQRLQDERFGEVGLSIRQYVSNVEKEMHQIEIWGRDNFVLKGDFMKATDRLEDAIKSMTSDLKTDMRALTNKIDAMKEN